MSQFPISFVFTGKTFYDCWFCICSFVELVFAFFLYCQFLCVNKFVFLQWKLQKLIYSSADGLDAFASFGKLPNDPFKTYNNTYIILINAGSCNEVTVVQYTIVYWHTHTYEYLTFFSILFNTKFDGVSLFDSLKNFDWELWPKQILAAFAHCTEWRIEAVLSRRK